MPLIHDSSDWMSHIWIDLGCMAFAGGCVDGFLHFFKKNALSAEDPRIAETMGVYVQLHSEAKAAGNNGDEYYNHDKEGSSFISIPPVGVHVGRIRGPRANLPRRSVRMERTLGQTRED